MKKPAFISRSETLYPEYDFERLKEMGIDEIQRLAGNKWTDYNIHDPGVTILEQLCYAITDLGYRTNYDINELLASQQDTSNINDTFFTPAYILQGKSITISDYRKVLIDRVNGLRDVWIEPLNLSAGKDEIKGIYIVLVKPSPAIIKNTSDREQLLTDTRKCLEKYSNLGEAFSDIVILEEEKIYVTADIELESEVNAERTHAEVLFNIKRSISSPIKFYSLAEMRDLGYSIEEIFNGPRLRNGFIQNDQLKDKITTLLTSHLINVIYNVKGVSKVYNVLISKSVNGSIDDQPENEFNSSQDDGSKSTDLEDGVLIDMNKVAVLAEEMMPYDRNAKPLINYYKNGVKINLFKNNVIRYLRQIENANRVEYYRTYQDINDISRKEGERKPIDDYYSIQEHFPAIYALGSQGIPPSLGVGRKAKVKQLKTYLLLFEQILTNYIAQLSNFSKLFSLDGDLSHSYFAGSLETIPYVKDLLSGLNNVDENSLEKQTRQISQAALESIDDFEQRRHRALDHLLARFGEHVSSFGIEKFNYYYDEEEHRKRMILSKMHLLREIPFLSAKRAKSFNAMKNYWHEETKEFVHPDSYFRDNISYVEKKVKIKLGIKMQNIKIAESLEKQIGKFHQAEPLHLRDLSKELLRRNIADEKIAFYSVSDRIINDDTFKPGLRIDEDILRRGIWPDNLKIITLEDKKGKNLVAFSKKPEINTLSENTKETIKEILDEQTEHLEYKPERIRFWNTAIKDRQLLIEYRKTDLNEYDPVPVNIWLVLKELKSRDEAKKYASSLLGYLRKQNISSEGFYLIDHIELRPREKDYMHGIVLRHRNNRTAFISARRYRYVEIQEALLKLIKDAKEPDFHHEGPEEEIHTSMLCDGETIGHYKNLDKRQTLSPEQREEDLKSLFDSLISTDLYDPSVIQFFLSMDTPEELDGGSFYSFRISLVIPAWSARFADPEFRKILETQFRDDSPAFIGLDFHYLDFNEFFRFEKLYRQWLEDLKYQADLDKLDTINTSSENLAVFIKKLENQSK